MPGVLTLEEALRECTGCGLLLDIKLAPEEPIEVVGEPIREARAIDRTLVGVRQLRHAAILRGLDSGFRMLAFSPDPDAVDDWQAAGASWFRLWQSDLTPGRAARVREQGLGLAVMSGGGGWPSGTIAHDQRPFVFGLRPDALLLDDPREAAEGPCHGPVATRR